MKTLVYKTHWPLLSTLLISLNCISSNLINSDLNLFIEKSDLIVHFKLADKSSAKESMLKTFSMVEDGVVIQKELMSTGIYTTYTLDIIEVLSGSLDKKSLKIKMSGGCFEDICATTSIGYDYEINQEGVIFLNHDETSGNYFSYAANNSAYKVGSNNILYTGENELNIEVNRVADVLDSKNDFQLTIDKLKDEVFIIKSKSEAE